MRWWERTTDAGSVLLDRAGCVFGRIERGERLDALTHAWRTFDASGNELPLSGWQFEVFAKREVEESIERL